MELMPLFQLPFYLRGLLQGAVVGLSVGAMFATWTILADRNVWYFRNVTNLFTTWRMGRIDEAKRFPLFKKVMFFLAAIFLIIGIFHAIVLLGVIENGDRPPLPTVDEFIRQQQQKRGS